MNAHIITRHISIGMLAFCATFVEASMFVASHFGPANAQPVQASQGISDSAYARLDSAPSDKASQRGA